MFTFNISYHQNIVLSNNNDFIIFRRLSGKTESYFNINFKIISGC